jgi:hypothetical protein
MAKKKKPAQDPEVPDSYGTASRGAGRSPRIHHTRPEVAAHVARLVVGCNMDFEAAVSRMWVEEYPDATDAQIQETAETLIRSSHVRRAIEAQLEKIGFGDKAQSRLIALLWKEVLGSNDKRFPIAARLLAEITQAAKANQRNEKMPTLRIAGIEEGVKTMLGDSAPTDNYATIDIEEDSDATGSSDTDPDSTT